MQDRNFPLNWTATNEGWEFIPNGTTAYNINAIPYSPIVAGVANWFDATGNVIGTGPTINVTPSSTTTYYCQISVLIYGATPPSNHQLLKKYYLLTILHNILREQKN